MNYTKAFESMVEFALAVKLKNARRKTIGPKHAGAPRTR